MNILSIGNSFSQDAHRYLHRIAKADGYALDTFNLYIGRCPLSVHYRNMLSEKRDYSLEMNGVSTGFKVSLGEALLNRDWDVVTVQQVSGKSPYYETYQPYLTKLVEYVKLCVPNAKIALHHTWAYEQDSKLLNITLGYQHHTDMFRDVEKAYKKAEEAIHPDLTIPSGALFQNLLASGIEKVHRDTLHASLGLGRYAIALLWYAVLSGNDVQNNTFCDFDEEIPEEQIAIAKKCVLETLKQNGR